MIVLPVWQDGNDEPEASSLNYNLIFPPFRMAPFWLRTPDLDRMEEEEPEADENTPLSRQWMDKTPDNSPTMINSTSIQSYQGWEQPLTL